MKLSRFGKTGHAGELDFELNLAPIIDCLTVLITFTLISASFLSISIFDAGAAPSNAGAKSDKEPTVSIELELQRDFSFEIKVSGNTNRNIRVPASNGAWDNAALSAQLKELKGIWPDVDGVALSAQGKVDYKSIVKAMETVRETYPAVMLGGF